MTRKNPTILLRLILLLAILLPLAAGAVAVKDVENVHIKNSTRYVTDMAGMLSPAAVTRIDSLMSDVWRQSSAEPVVVIVDNLDGEEVDDYATELFDLWRPGKKDKDNGVIFLISLEDRKFVIRTGYGAEGVLPDAICWGILENTLKPALVKGEYDLGVTAAAAEIAGALTSEEARAELMSKYANDSRRGEDGPSAFTIYLIIAGMITAGFAIYYFSLLTQIKGKETAEAYHLFDKSKVAVMALTAATLGFMLPVMIAWLLTMRHIRNRRHICSNCGHAMHKLDEETDNNYLTPAQDKEEQLNSVDYDVWLCPECNQTDIIPFINRQKNYSICHVCGARTAALVSDRIITQPTTLHEGRGVKTCRCYNCGNTTNEPYSIPKVVAPPIIIGGGGGHGFGGGGGGFSGGSFGGGMTGGGGASGGW